jgi:hypothetical protein
MADNQRRVVIDESDTRTLTPIRVCRWVSALLFFFSSLLFFFFSSQARGGAHSKSRGATALAAEAVLPIPE